MEANVKEEDGMEQSDLAFLKKQMKKNTGSQQSGTI